MDISLDVLDVLTEDHRDALATEGIDSTEALLFAGTNAAERQALAERMGIAPDDLLRAITQADLLRLPGIDLEQAQALIGLGVGASGTSLLALLATATDPRRRAAAATITWLMMIAGIALTAGGIGALLDPYSPALLLRIVAGVTLGALVLTVLATWGIERRLAPPAPQPEPPSLIEGLRENYRARAEQVPGLAAYAGFFEGPLNNARLNGVHDYYGLVGTFQQLLLSCGGHWDCFWQAVEVLAERDG